MKSSHKKTPSASPTDRKPQPGSVGIKRAQVTRQPVNVNKSINTNTSKSVPKSSPNRGTVGGASASAANVIERNNRLMAAQIQSKNRSGPAGFGEKEMFDIRDRDTKTYILNGGLLDDGNDEKNEIDEMQDESLRFAAQLNAAGSNFNNQLQHPSPQVLIEDDHLLPFASSSAGAKITVDAQQDELLRKSNSNPKNPFAIGGADPGAKLGSQKRLHSNGSNPPTKPTASSKARQTTSRSVSNQQRKKLAGPNGNSNSNSSTPNPTSTSACSTKRKSGASRSASRSRKASRDAKDQRQRSMQEEELAISRWLNLEPTPAGVRGKVLNLNLKGGKTKQTQETAVMPEVYESIDLKHRKNGMREAIERSGSANAKGKKVGRAGTGSVKKSTSSSSSASVKQEAAQLLCDKDDDAADDEIAQILSKKRLKEIDQQQQDVLLRNQQIMQEQFSGVPVGGGIGSMNLMESTDIAACGAMLDTLASEMKQFGAPTSREKAKSGTGTGMIGGAGTAGTNGKGEVTNMGAYLEDIDAALEELQRELDVCN